MGDALKSHPLPPPSPFAFNLSNELALCIRWPKYWSFSFSISPYNEYSGLISFRMDWLDLLAVQVTLKSLLQQHNSKASILWSPSFFMVQISHPYMTTGKTIALTVWTFISKVMSLRPVSITTRAHAQGFMKSSPLFISPLPNNTNRTKAVVAGEHSSD